MEPEPIFGPYWNGRNNVYQDPLKIRRILKAALDGKPDVWIGRTASPDPVEASLALDKIAKAARSAFDMVPFDGLSGKGATETQCLRAVQMFLDWQSSKKVSTKPSPICSPPTGLGEDRPTTKSTSDCS